MKLDIHPNTAAWSEERRKRVTASEIPIIMGISPYKTAFKLWREKMGFIIPDAPSSAMMLGHEYEPHIRQLVEDATGSTFRPEVHIHDEFQWAMASLDGVEVCESVEDPFRLLECKVNNKDNHELAKNDQVPLHHLYQMQWQMLVTGADLVIYASYHVATYSLHIVNVEADEEIQSKCLEAAMNFHESMLHFRAPPKCERDYKEERDSYTHIDDPEAVKIAQATIPLVRQRKLLKVQLDALEKQIQINKDFLVEYSDDGNFECDELLVQRIEKPGNVDWKKLCKDKKISDEELNKYRKQEIGFWQLKTRD